MDVFDDDRDREIYIELMAEQCRRFRVEVLAWCLMSNHVHLVMVPSRAAALAAAVGEAHKRYTRMKNFASGARGYLFQGRFGSCVLDERHLLAAARYAELNPVRAGTAASARDYRWSSARFHLGRRKTDPLVADRTLRGLVDDWAAFLGEEDTAAQAALRLATRTGRPAGSRRFLRRMERLTGRTLRRGRRGRPPKAGK